MTSILSFLRDCFVETWNTFYTRGGIWAVFIALPFYFVAVRSLIKLFKRR